VEECYDSLGIGIRELYVTLVERHVAYCIIHCKASAIVVVGPCEGDVAQAWHLKAVAVPVRLSIKKIGEAPLVCARVRPKFVGGARAVYDESLL
jgi:hypothetical protein